MNSDEVKGFIRSVSAFRPDFAAWWGDQVGVTCRSTGLGAAEAVETMFASVCRQLAEVDASESIDLLSQLEAGDKQLPATAGGYVRWEEFIGFVRRTILDERRQRRMADRSVDRDSEQRFHCLDCLDAGHVLVFYPPFLEWLRPTFEEMQRTGFPAGWFTRVAGQWYGRLKLKQVRAAATVPLACVCDSPAATIYRAQVRSMKDSGGVKRAAYIGVWNPEKMCRIAGDEAEDLARWYATHRANDSFDWTPDLMQYAGGEKFGDE